MSESEPQYLYLTTTGWKSGKPHEIEIWFTSLEDRWYVLAEYGDHAHWVQNLRHQARVTFRIADRVYRGLAGLLDESAQPALAQRVRSRSTEKYGWGGGTIVQLQALNPPADD